MTILQFQSCCKESVNTIRKWLQQGYIPGANQDPETGEWEIPAHARPPYTRARTKTAQSVYTSIVDASNKRHHVFPALYRLDPSEFEGYIDILVKADLVCRRTVDGIAYYDVTLEGQEYASQSNDKFRKSELKRLGQTVIIQLK